MKPARLAIGALGLVTGLGTFVLVRDNPGGSLATSSTLRGIALLIAGWLAVAVGLLIWRRTFRSRSGAFLAAAGFAWFVAEWNNPGVDSPLVFTLGLVFYAACPPLVAHCALTFPSGRLVSWVDRCALTVAYGSTLVVLGLGPAVAFGPSDQACRQCAANLLSVTSNPGVVASLTRAGVRLGVAWTIALVALIAWRLVGSTPTVRRLNVFVLVPGIAYLCSVAATYIHALGRGILSNDSHDRRTWLAQACTLSLISIGVAADRLRARRSRAAVARLVVALADAPSTGGLRDALANTLGDPDLEIGYPSADDMCVDAVGRPLSTDATAGRATTALVRDGETIALIIHKSDLLGDPRLVQEAAAAARLAFENERLQAEASVQLAELHNSRARLIAASDAERRRLERDLHDGAQQHFVGLTLAMSLTRGQLDRAANSNAAATVEAAEVQLREAVGELRTLASSIHPVVLTDHGLAAAIEALAEGGTAPVRLQRVPEERLPAPVETAAYLVVASAAKVGAVRVNIVRCDDKLVVDVDATREPPDLVDLDDRLGALDGTLGVERTADGVHLHAEIPCA